MLISGSVSIIVPIYKGKRYIKRIIQQISKNYEYVKEFDCEVELVLVNDYPEETIDSNDISFSDVNYRINIINSSINQGIHGARLLGIANCSGEYIVMLDQDDLIFERYLYSQLANIGDNKAVVCRLIHEGREFYNVEYPFDDAMNMDYMLKFGCPIVSPGQVMIKKSALPTLWLEHKMKYNGADDFLLWLSLLNAGVTFALNQEVVFEHVVEYDNNSWKSVDMIESERELIEILKNDSHFLPEYAELLDSLEKQLFTRRINQLDKFKKMFFIYDGIMKAKYEGITIAGYLLKHTYRKIAVFGYGYIGKMIIREIETDTNISLEYVIDKNADYLTSSICAYKIDDSLPETDCIIVSLVQNEEIICEKLKEKTSAEIIDIKKLLINMTGKEKDVTL